MEGGADLAVPGVGCSQEPPTPGHCERLLCYFQAKSELCISSPYCFVKQYLQSTENVLFSHRIAFLSILWASVGSLICGPAPWSPKGPGMQLYFRITSFLVTQHILFHTFKRIILRSLQASLDGTKMVISSRLPWVKGTLIHYISLLISYRINFSGHIHFTFFPQEIYSLNPHCLIISQILKRN